MTGQFAEEIAANLERAEQSIQAARQLESGLYYDFAAARAYYAAYYAATALLLNEGVEVSKHSGVIAAIHQRFVKTGKLDKTLGKSLNWLFELRSVGDYGGGSRRETRRACPEAAEGVCREREMRPPRDKIVDCLGRLIYNISAGAGPVGKF